MSESQCVCTWRGFGLNFVSCTHNPAQCYRETWALCLPGLLHSACLHLLLTWAHTRTDTNTCAHIPKNTQGHMHKNSHIYRHAKSYMHTYKTKVTEHAGTEGQSPLRIFMSLNLDVGVPFPDYNLFIRSPPINQSSVLSDIYMCSRNYLPILSTSAKV